MATLSLLSSIINGGGDRKDPGGEPTALITKDLLGGGRLSSVDSKDQLDLDLDVHVPYGWEKRLDLKSGKVYINKCDSSKTKEDNKNNKVNYTTTPTPPSKLQDLNICPPLNSNMTEKQSNFNLSLLLSSTPSPSTRALSPVVSSSSFHNICTLDKVKSALERAEKEEAKCSRNKRWSVSMMSTSSHSHSSSSVKACDQLMEEEEEEKSSLSVSESSAMYAASCPNCLLYVLVYKDNPKCPRCQVTVPSPTALKKPRIDLNISL